MSHTPSNLRVTEVDRIVPESDESLNDGYFIADCYGPDSDDNARRFVASWNACRGIGTNTLERFHSDHSPENGFGVHRESKLETERDTYRDLCGELLKALKGAQSTLAHCRADIGYRNRQDATAISIHKAITRAESVMGENSDE